MNELMFTGWQVIYCAITFLAAGIAIGVNLLQLIKWKEFQKCASCEEGEEVDRPYTGEPNGCNNRMLRAKVLGC